MGKEKRILMGMKVSFRIMDGQGFDGIGYVMLTKAMMDGEVEAKHTDNFKYRIGMLDNDGKIGTTMHWFSAHEMRVIDSNIVTGIALIHDYYETLDDE